MKLGTKLLVAIPILLGTAIAGLTNILTSAVSADWIRTWLRPLSAILVTLLALWILFELRNKKRPAGMVSRFEGTAHAATADSSDSGVLDLVVAAKSGAVGHAQYREPGLWSAWRDVRCPVKALDVACVSVSTGRLECFVVSHAGDLWYSDDATSDGPRWAELTTDPALGRLVAVAAMSGWKGHREIYVVGEHGGLAHRWKTEGEPWSDWHNAHPPTACRDVGLSVPARDQLECFVAGRAGGIWHRWFIHGHWSSWERMDTNQPIGGVAIDALNAHDQHQEIFVVTLRGHIANRPHWQGTPWPAWRQMDTPAPLTDIAVGTTSDGRLECVGVDQHGALWQQSYRDGSAWTSWRPVSANNDSLTSGHGR